MGFNQCEKTHPSFKLLGRYEIYPICCNNRISVRDGSIRSAAPD